MSKNVKEPGSGDPSGSRRARANRENAKRSTGPRTEEGKARSAANSTTHGMYATHSVAITRGHFTEDPDEVRELLEGIVLDLAPRNFIEVEQAHQVAVLYLRMRRLERFEAAALCGTNGANDGPRPDTYGEFRRRVAIADWALGMPDSAELDFGRAAPMLLVEFGFSAEEMAELLASVPDAEADDHSRRVVDAILAAKFPDKHGLTEWALEFSARAERLIDGALDRQSTAAQKALKGDMDQSARIYQRISRDVERALAIYRGLRNQPERFVI